MGKKNKNNAGNSKLAPDIEAKDPRNPADVKLGMEPDMEVVDQSVAIPKKSKLSRFKIDKFRDIWYLAVFLLNLVATIILCIYLAEKYSIYTIRDACMIEISLCLFVATFISAVVLLCLVYRPAFVKFALYICPGVALAAGTIALFTTSDFKWVYGLLGASMIIMIVLFAMLFSNNTRLAQPFYTSISDILKAYPTSILFIILSMALTIAYMILWGFAFAVNFTEFKSGVFWYLLLSLYWTMESMRYFVHIVMAGIVARHYLQIDEEKKGKDITKESVRVALTYTAGSTTMGALLLTPITLLRQLLWIFNINADQKLVSSRGSVFGRFFGLLFKTFHPFTLTWMSIYGDERAYMDAAREIHHHFSAESGLKRVERKAFPDRLLFVSILMSSMACAAVSIAYIGHNINPITEFSPESTELVFACLFSGMVLVGITYEAIRGIIYATLVCYMEDSNAVRMADPELADHIDTIASRKEWVPQTPSSVDLRLTDLEQGQSNFGLSNEF